MRNEKFEKELMKRLEKHYGADYEIRIRDVVKLSQEPLRGLTVKRKNENIAPTIYLDYLRETDIEEVLKDIYEMIENSQRNKVYFHIESFTDWEMAKQRIHARLVGADDSLLNELPHRNYLNLAVVYYYVVDMDKEIGCGTITVRLEHLKHWGVDESELFEAAKENAESEGYTTENMQDILRELCSENMDIGVSVNPMYVITNASKFYGATALIFAKECFKTLAEKMNSSLYILPSSQHELIAIGKEIADIQALKEIVCNVNDWLVEGKDRLGYCIYQYNRATDRIDIAA